MSICKGCGAPIIWIKTKSGRAMPCDEKPLKFYRNRYGTETLVTDKGEVVKCELTENSDFHGIGYRPHWETCPAREFFKKR